MRMIALLSMVVLASCANPRAPENLNSVPNIQQSMTNVRGSGDYIYMTGGPFSGAATGQTATFVALPDDTVICTFQTDPVLPIDGPVAVVTGHRLSVAGIYRTLSGIVIPNVEATQIEFTTNFTVETGSTAGIVTTRTGFGDPRFERLMAVFAANPTPCWSFG